MPPSPSPSRDTKSPSRSYWPIALIGLTAVLVVVIATVPASVVTRFLPPAVQATDFSGSIWHGSAGKISLNGHDAGALEWHLQPAALLGMNVAAEIHWVKVGFVADAVVQINRQGFTAHDMKAAGPIGDLHDLGVAAGWRGTAEANFKELKGDFVKLQAAVGDIQVSNVASAQIASGADLGSYNLHLGDNGVDAEGNVNAQLADTEGPLEVQTLIHYSTKNHTGMLTGTVKERPNASPALLNQLQNISQLRARDAQGRISIDLEFSL